MNNKIGIKLADGSFYPILEEGSPQSKIIELTTVRDDQTTVQLDLYRSSSDDMEDAEYVDTLLVENLLPRPKETPTLNLKIELDSENVLSASIEDCESGESSATKVSLVNLDSSERTIVPDFSMIDAETADNEEADSLLDEFADNTIAVSGETTMENELDNNEDLNLDDFDDVDELLTDDVENQDNNLPELDDLSEIQAEPVLDEMPEIESESTFEETDNLATKDFADLPEIEDEPVLDEMPEIESESTFEESDNLATNDFADLPEIEDEPVLDEMPEIESEATFEETDNLATNDFVDLPEIEDEPVLDEMSEIESESTFEETDNSATNDFVDLPEIEDEPVLDEMPEIESEATFEETDNLATNDFADLPEIEDEPVLDEMPTLEDDFSSESTDIMQDSILDSSDFAESANEGLDIMEEEFPDFSDIPTASENDIVDSDLDSDDDDGFFGIGNDYGDLNTDMDFDDDAFDSNIDTSILDRPAIRPVKISGWRMGSLAVL
ncbi:MAG: hypothetical protein II232_05955 [Spirochaetaceae bacterium]|nr:hypothetical protein [Spirochaetaceae bacterium]